MDYRSLGRTGIQVSPLCLGAMMFGSFGEPDHDKSIAIIHAALDAGINFIDTADAYSQGESEVIVGKALAGGKRDDVVLATKVNIQMGVPVGSPPGTTGDPNKRGNSRRWIVTEVENSLRRLNTDWIDLYQIHRPDPAHRHRRDPRSTHRFAAAGQDPRLRVVDVSRPPDGPGAVGERAPRSRPVRHRAAALFAAGPRDRGRRSAGGAGVRDGRAAVEPAGRWLAERGYRKDKELPESRRRAFMPGRFDMSRPENQRKLDAADALGTLADDAGLSLIHLALAFVMQHPAVTAPIIGPRTLDHLKSQLGATDVTLSVDVLDRIDEIVPPGSTISRGDQGYQPPSLTDPFSRRRRTV